MTKQKPDLIYETDDNYLLSICPWEGHSLATLPEGFTAFVPFFSSFVLLSLYPV